jgi:hypothetical protein
LENLHLFRTPNHSSIIKYIGKFGIPTKAEVSYLKKQHITAIINPETDLAMPENVIIAP